MSQKKLPEVWLRGPVAGIPALLQPVAHALLQAREEVNEMVIDLSEDKLWLSLAGMASVGFHLQHLTGVLDRLFTYANGQMLDTDQLSYLATEGNVADIDTIKLIAAFNKQVDLAIEQLKQTNEQVLTEVRGVGRAQMPSTVIGLYVHAAEHTMRHTGQLLVTVNFIAKLPGKNPI